MCSVNADAFLHGNVGRKEDKDKLCTDVVQPMPVL